MDTRIVDLGEWLPDQPPLNNPGATEALNVIPALRGYKPLASLQPISEAVADPCRGAGAFRTLSGSAAIFVGTVDALYSSDTGGTWDDVSITGGYSLSDGERWSFTQFGNLIASCAIDEAPQSFVLGSSTDFAALSATAPQARYSGVIKESLFLGNINDLANTSDGVVPNRVHWSGFNEPDAWPAAGSTTAQEKQSDFQDLPNGGAVRGITGAVGGADGVIFMDAAIYRVQFEGPPTFYGFYEVEHSKGCAASFSIVNTGYAVFYLSEEGFCAFNGSVSAPIGEQKVNDWLYSIVDANRLDEVTGAYDRISQCVFWSFPSVSCPASMGADSVIIYSIPLQRWTHANINMCSLLPFYAPGVSIDDIDALYPSGLDSIPVSLDSRTFMAGRLSFGAIDADNKLATFSGAVLPATVETGEINGDGAGRKVYISGARPLVNGSSATVAVSSRNLQSDAIVWGAPVAQCENGICPQRTKARYLRARIGIAAAEDWTDCTGVEVRMQQEGDR